MESELSLACTSGNTCIAKPAPRQRHTRHVAYVDEVFHTVGNRRFGLQTGIFIKSTELAIRDMTEQRMVLFTP